MATLIKIDKNGSKHYEGYQPCDRCNGSGIYGWGMMISYGSGPAMPQYSGTCFKCGGDGKLWKTWIERTPEYQAKLDAKRQAKHEAIRAKRAEEEKAAQAKREAERIQKLKEEAERKAISQYVGEDGQRITLTVELLKRIEFEVPSFNGWGTETKFIYIFADESGNKIVWKTTSSLGHTDNGNWIPIQGGEKITIKGTVKGHGEYKGEKQTELQRVKLAA